MGRIRNGGWSGEAVDVVFKRGDFQMLAMCKTNLNGSGEFALEERNSMHLVRHEWCCKGKKRVVVFVEGRENLAKTRLIMFDASYIGRNVLRPSTDTRKKTIYASQQNDSIIFACKETFAGTTLTPKRPFFSEKTFEKLVLFGMNNNLAANH